MHMSRRVLGFVLLVCSSLFASPALSGSSGDSLRIVHTFPVNHPAYLRLKEMLPELQAAADYTVRFELYSAQELGGWHRIVPDLFEGRYDFLLSQASLLASNGIDVGPLERSDLFINFDTWKNLPESEGEEAIRDLFAESNLEYLGATWLTSDYLVLQTKVDKLSDLKGLVVRTPQNTMSFDFYEKLGMSPVSIGPKETFLALEAGMVDAAVMTASDSYWTAYWDASAKISGYGNTLISDRVGGQVAWLVARDSWRIGLDDFTIVQVEKALGEAMQQLGAELHASQQNLLETVSKQGATLTQFSDSDRNTMIDAVHGAWQSNFSPRDRLIAERLVGNK
ncbi:TRAP transporter solute receptor, DctP family [Roseibium album]|nr:TRAP transporter solute receptor, DctP family [Roseibium album]